MAHYVGSGKDCELPCYTRRSEMEDNDQCVPFPQEDAVKNIKIMYLYLLKRKMLLKYFLCERR